MRLHPLRAAASVTSTLALVAGGIAVTTTGAGADPVIDVDNDLCVGTPVRTSPLVAGDEVTGLTTISGIDPITFTGTFKSVLKNAAGRGKDILLFRMSGPRITDVVDGAAPAGIWAGMSGSPVYDGDGNLIGSVSYGFSQGTSNLAGVTPATDILDIQNAPAAQLAARRVALPQSVSTQIAKSTPSTRDDAGDFSTMPQLKLPRVAVGVSGKAATKFAAKSRQLKKTYGAATPKFATGSAAVDLDTEDAIVPGGNIATAWSHGDVTLASVGTITAVCGDEVYAFGHPDDFDGNKATETFHAAEAAEIQEDSAGTSFKLANIDLDPVGQVTQDRLSGILGVIGQMPTETTIKTTTTVGSDTTTATTKVSVPAATSTAVFGQLYNDVLDGLDAYVNGGQATLTWSINYTPKGGRPATYTRTQRTSTANYFAEQMGFDVASDVEFLQFGSDRKVTINSINIRTTLKPDYNALRVSGLDVRSKGKWVRVKRGAKVKARPGKKFPVLVHLTPASPDSVAKPTTRRLDQKIVGSAVGTGFLSINGTSGFFEEDDELTIDFDSEDEGDFADDEEFSYGSSPLTLPQVLAALKAQTRNDMITSTQIFVTPTGPKVRQRRIGTPAVTTGSWGIRLNYKK